MRARLIASVVWMLVLAGCGSGMQRSAATPPAQENGQVQVDRVAPDFTLTDQFGRTVSLHDYLGKVVVLAFTDSQCTTVCPLTTQSMAEALKLLGGAASQVQLVGVNSNPDATSVSDVLQYSQIHGLEHTWEFLTGTVPQLQAVWNGYQIEAAIVDGQAEHTPAMFVIDPAGHERYVYVTPMEYAAVPQEAAILAGDAARLLPSHPSVLPATIPGHLTSGSVKLPVIAGTSASGTVQVGDGHSMLMVYWASWLPDAAQRLRDLNQYSLDAGPKHLPPVVAIDLLTTEPTAGQATALLDRAGPFLYPVAQDTTGRVADLYGVQDLAWYAVTDGQGNVTWFHDGWMTTGGLEAALQG
jgi:cytochrome oxidase Cu insertion factor (SCO1/SenC/PrrC family)